MDVFRKKTSKETERKSRPSNSGSGEPCDQEAMERCILKRFYPHCMGANRKIAGKVRTQGKKPRRCIDKDYDRTAAQRMLRR